MSDRVTAVRTVTYTATVDRDAWVTTYGVDGNKVPSNLGEWLENAAHCGVALAADMADAGTVTAEVGSVPPNPSERLPVVNGSAVLAWFYDQEHDRFAVLVERMLPTTRDYVVGYVRTLTNAEWMDGYQYYDAYERAVEAFAGKMKRRPAPA